MRPAPSVAVVATMFRIALRVELPADLSGDVRFRLGDKMYTFPFAAARWHTRIRCSD